MAELVAVTSLEFRQELYPRNKVVDAHVTELGRVLDGGHELPPIIVWRKNNWIVDGVHRWTLAVRRGVEQIAAEWRDYETEAEFFKDSVLANTAFGLNLSTHDRLKVLDISAQFGLKELEVAEILRTSPSYIKAIMPRYATLADVPAGKRGKAEKVRRVPLKNSTRHLAGQTITLEQADAIRGNAPGTSYLLIVRQLISGLEHDLLPPQESHPVLWAEIQRLAALLTALPAAV